MSLECRPVTPADFDAVWDLERRCFDVDDAGRARWQAAVDPTRLFGVFDAGRLVAMAQVLPFAQFFGGRSVSMGGVASVAVAPEARGRGHAGRLMATILADMRAHGEAVSTLFPAATALYRAHGWEVAGRNVRAVVAPEVLRALRPARPVALRRATRDDSGALAACYARVAPGVNGFLDRSAARWAWLLGTWETFQVYVAEDAGRVAGYAIYRHATPRPHHLAGFGMEVYEVIADDRDVLAALWGLVGSSSTQVNDVVVRGSSDDALLLLLLPEQVVHTTHTHYWMLRLVDAPAAIAARGFPPGLGAEIALELADHVVPENAGRWVLRIGDGRGRLEHGGAGDVRLDVGALASLYTGFATTAQLAATGRLAGDAMDARARLDAAFAGRMPWMAENF